MKENVVSDTEGREEKMNLRSDLAMGSYVCDKEISGTEGRYVNREES